MLLRILLTLMGCLANDSAFFASRSLAQVAAPFGTVDQGRAAAAGIRKLVGRHLTLFTDVTPDTEVNRLPDVFDRAVPQWAHYFNVPSANVRDWRMQAFLIHDRADFDALGLMPVGNEEFRHGFSLGHELWMYEQPTAYYRRHLLLHEGTHGFMATLLGGCGAGWFMEGTAELMATHHWDVRTGRLTLRYMPTSRQDVPMLGRIKLVQDAFRENRALALPAVMDIDNRRFLNSEAYAWCWALARFLDDHPRYRQRFRSLLGQVTDADFNNRARQLFADDWPDLLVEWQDFVSTLSHGHDVARTAIDFRQGRPLAGETVGFKIAADRGWQSTEVLLQTGSRYRITAQGRYQIAEETGVRWPCEPGGITIEYVAGRPLGMLLAAIDDRREGASLTGSFVQPMACGLVVNFTPARSGTLYLRVNDSPGQLDDNAGSLQGTIEAL